MSLVLLLVIATFGQQNQSPAHRVKQANHSDRKNETKDNSPQPQQTPPTTVTNAIKKPSAEIKQSSSEAKPNKWREAFAPSTWVNWGLLIVGFGGVLVAIVTLKALIQQTNATTVAANAALLGSNTTTSAERAYITIKGSARAAGFYEFSCINEGRTPAEVTSIFSDFAFPDSENDLGQLINYGTEEFPDPKVLAPKEDIEIRDWAIGREVKIEEGKILVYYGRICYRDVLGNPHESRFCFRFDPIQHKLIRWGPKGYNQHT